MRCVFFPSEAVQNKFHTPCPAQERTKTLRRSRILFVLPELDPMKRWLTWTVYATLLMTLTTDLGLSIRVSMFEHLDW